MSKKNEVKINVGGGAGGCGCVSLIIFILLFWAIFFGLPIGKHKWNIDIFPPRIWDMSADNQGDNSE